MKAFMGRMMAGVSRLVGGIGGGLGKWIQKPGQMVMMAGQQVWQAGEWALDTAASVVEYGLEAVDTAVGYTAQAAIHVAQDFDKAVGYTAQAAIHIGQDIGDGARLAGRVAWNNPASLLARNVGRYMIGDHRPRIVQEGDKQVKAGADKALKQAREIDPSARKSAVADLTKRIKTDPEMIKAYAETADQTAREELLKQMSLKAKTWVESLSGLDLWALKRADTPDIAAHLAGVKPLQGVKAIEDYYGAAPLESSSKASVLDGPVTKTVSENSRERKAKKLQKRDAAMGVANDAQPIPATREATRVVDEMNDTRTATEKVADWDEARRKPQQRREQENERSVSSGFAFRPPMSIAS